MDNSLELQVMKYFLTKDNFNAYKSVIPDRVFSGKVKDLYYIIEYLHKDSDRQILTTQDIYSAYKLHGSPTTAKLELVQQILLQIDKQDYIDNNIIQKARDKELARQIAEHAVRVMNAPIGDTSLEKLITFVQSMDYGALKEETNYCSTNIEELEAKADDNFIFGVGFLQRVVPSPTRGQFMIVFASTNSGKSTFVAHLNVGYIKQNLKVLYFANEEPATKIMMNHIRSCENKPELELFNTKKTPEWDKYKHNLYVVAAHDYTFDNMEKNIKHILPDIIVIDQLDNIQQTNKNAARHEQLETTYQNARVLASRYNCLVIAVSQANDSASDKMVLKSNMLANSRIGKAGAADLILGIGMRDVEDDTRCITICKNKINGVHKKVYCKIDAARARYLE